MNRDKRFERGIMIILGLLFFLCMAAEPCGLGSVSVDAATVKKSRTVSYTVRTGKSKKILAIVRESSFRKKVKKKCACLTWRSNSSKIARVIKNKRIRGVKAGSTYIYGYNKKNKKVAAIYITIKDPPKPKRIRVISSGSIKGKKNQAGTAMIWYGVPYGADTGGDNRWKAPQPVTSWTGIRKATSKRKNAVRASGESYAGTEDCLFVNIYRPYTRDTDLPVMVYLHGGNNNSGTANTNFSSLAVKMNAVIVSVSYRLGAFGFLSHPALQTGVAEEDSGNFALLDIRQALCWVQEEINVFGGDPTNVTLSGFSAGARDVLMCMISPVMQGLFHKAIVLSGGMTVCTPEEGKFSVEEKLAAILVKRGEYANKSAALQYIQAASTETVRELFYSLTTVEIAQMYKSFHLRLSNFPQGFTDGVVLPAEGFSAIVSGNYNQVPVILGSDATEFSSFAWQDSSFFTLNAGLENLAAQSLDSMDLLSKGILYGSQLQSAYNVEKTAEILTQDADHEKIYAFRFRWGTNATVTDSFYSQYVGAYHGAAKDFLRGVYPNSFSLYSPKAVSADNKAGRKALTTQMRSYIKNFLIQGNPNGASLTKWNIWNKDPNSNKIMSFNAGKKRVTSKMSEEQYNQNLILYSMYKNLTSTEYSFLTNIVLKDRFFMPAVIY